MTEKKESKSTQVIYVKKAPKLKVNARVRPILKQKQKTIDFFEGKEVEVTKEQLEALNKRNWIEVKNGK